jgi:hypothetical protein
LGSSKLRVLTALAVVVLMMGGCDDGGGGDRVDDMTVGEGGNGGAAGGAGGAGAAGGAGGGEGGAGGGEGGAGGGEPVEQLGSRRPRVRFKRTDRIRFDFARALSLEPDQLCTELAFSECFDVHGIALGGVEAYDANIYEPFENTSIAAPMVVERIATFACSRRIFLDVSERESSQIWGGVPTEGDRTVVSDIEGPEAIEAITAMFTRGLQRRPTAAEIAGAQAMYREIAASDSDQPAFHWAQGLCVAVLTSVESLFY